MMKKLLGTILTILLVAGVVLVFSVPDIMDQLVALQVNKANQEQTGDRGEESPDPLDSGIGSANKSEADRLDEKIRELLGDDYYSSSDADDKGQEALDKDKGPGLNDNQTKPEDAPLVQETSSGAGTDKSASNKDQTNLIDNISIVPLKSSSYRLALHGVELGLFLDELLDFYGEPERIDPSPYDFNWYIYNVGQIDYLQVGVKGDKVVALMSLTGRSGPLADLRDRNTARALFGQPLTALNLGGRNYREADDTDQRERDIFAYGDAYIYVYYDLIDNDIIGLQAISKLSRHSLLSFFTKGSSELGLAYEREEFDISNAMRASRGLPTYTWSNMAALSARGHSEDMARSNFFEHDNLKGESPLDRMEAVGIILGPMAENIIAGYEDPLSMHTGWMNSPGHRANLLIPNLEFLGLGVAFGGQHKIYATQNFFSLPY